MHNLVNTASLVSPGSKIVAGVPEAMARGAAQLEFLDNGVTGLLVARHVVELE